MKITILILFSLLSLLVKATTVPPFIRTALQNQSHAYKLTNMSDKPFRNFNSPLKDRFPNLPAAEQTRIKLLSQTYINANLITYKQFQYIAGQYPIPAAFVDTWQMIDEQEIDTIIILSREEEDGEKQGDRYWPLQGSLKYGQLQIHHIKTLNFKSYIQHTLKLQTRTITIYEYLNWQVMQSTNPTLLINFMKASRGVSVFVHCSAGVGRVGAFITLDVMMKMKVSMKEERDLVVDVLKEIKKQRYFNLTKGQFRMVYVCLDEYYQSRSRN